MDLLNFIVLAFEIIYYSLFMKSIKREGKFWKYVVIFVISTIFTLIFSKYSILSYVFIIFSTLIVGKYILKINMKLYDFYLILAMMFFKILIEAITYTLFVNILGQYITIFLFEFLKILFVFIFNKALNKVYEKGMEVWENNNFYIRYFTAIILILYLIFTVLAITFF